MHDPSVDERARADRDAHRRGRREWPAAACEERKHGGENRQHVEPQRALWAVPVVLPDGRFGNAEADAGDDQRVEPVAARKRPELLPLHVLKVLHEPADRLARENDLKIVREEEPGSAPRPKMVRG